MEYLTECALDAARDRIIDGVDKLKVRSNLSNYIDEKWKYNEVSTLAEEIDFQGLADYVKKDLLDSVIPRLFSLDEQEQKQVRDSIANAAIAQSKAKTNEAKSRVKESILDCLDIIREFYYSHIGVEDRVLAAEVLKHMDQSTRQAVEDLVQVIVSQFENLQTNKESTCLAQAPTSNAGPDLSSICDWNQSRRCLDSLSSEYLQEIYASAKRLGTLEFIPEAMNHLNVTGIATSENGNPFWGLLAACLRSAYHEKVLDEDLAKEQVQFFLAGKVVPIPAKLLIELAQAKSFDALYKSSVRSFWSLRENAMRSALSFVVLSIFFTDLYLILTKYPEEHSDMIRYKTNADICQGLYNLPQHISFERSCPLWLDEKRHRLDVCLMCDDPNAHKAATLFVNEFERAVVIFEDVFSQIGLQIYYIRAKIHAYGMDHVNNYNFEAYTPTLMPLLSGGHLYSSRLVFIRELVQNAIDSIAVRQASENESFLGKIEIRMELPGGGRQLSFLKITDNGMGMGPVEIERYLTSIGRSFYTAKDFKKMKLSYKPISSFGIGFLSCFLVCSSIHIHTRSMAEKNAYELWIPNIEGCFFIEESKIEFPVGTQIDMDMTKAADGAETSLLEVLGYASTHFLDIGFDVHFSWDGRKLVTMCPIDWNGNKMNLVNSDIAQFMRKEQHPVPCPFSYTDSEIILEAGDEKIFRDNWWNRYMKKQLREVRLGSHSQAFSELVIKGHASRVVGNHFFLFIPFTGDGDIPDQQFTAVEDTYKYPYGMFITDLPAAGMKIRSENNGIRTYSGTLRVLNAGILVDEGRIEPIFGQEMNIYQKETETAYNNVIINFPPDWIELNVAREKIIGLSKDAVCKEKLLKGIAKSTIRAIDSFIADKRDIPLVNIQEIASFITVVCDGLNGDASGEGKKLLAELRRKKFFLQLAVLPEEGLCFDIQVNNGKSIDMKTWLSENCGSMPDDMAAYSNPKAEEFFKAFELHMGKSKIESVDEMNRILAYYFRVPGAVKSNMKHDFSVALFAVYLALFPEERIMKFASKAARVKVNLERQLQKRYTVADCISGRAHEIVTFDEIRELLKYTQF